ncbi:extracellular solute-binding protein [Cohnella ginsengisoli]|uniref:Extracellular solute-binding protein n=1 Tax=Cohnella ginsengisoli TaxID=425004 RepID=A0A9X4QN58_9BACL|nr:extracellular solute-binding protein [Cohnella ginsengisoli]MDG0791555.1 extracellular solute-binding protein [Cohnella ginsengisoli]
MTFYGKIVEYTSGEKMVAAMQDQLKDKYEIDSIQVDWANLEKVVKTGIASGSPADVYEFWPQNMKTFVTAQQALDLTPYLEANGGEWKNAFNQTLLDLGKYDGKYYAVPLGSNFSVVYVNKDIFDKAGVEVPTEWTWDKFLEASKAIKDKAGVYPFAIGKDLQNWLARNGVMSLGVSEGKQDALAAGEVPATDAIFSTVLKNIKDLYDKQYWYPGKGALTISRDEAKAAFYQGKVAMLAEVSADARGIISGAQGLNVAVASWPSMGDKNAVLGGADGLFIPANAKDKDASVELLKSYLSADVQKIHADEGYAAANVNVQVSDPVVQSIMQLSADVQAKEFYNLGPKISDFFDKELISSYVLGSSESDVLGKLEKLRQQTIQQ